MENFELHRVNKKLEELKHEAQTLNQQIIKTRQSEQFELDMLRRRFDGVIRRLENRRVELEKEEKNYHRQLDRIEKQELDAKEKEAEEREREEFESRRRQRM